MALRSFSGWLCGCNTIAAAGASIAVLFAPSVARAQYVQYAAPPPPPPPPYYREYREPREPISAFALGLDLEGVLPVNPPQLADGTNLNGGGGVKVRVGEQIRFSRWLRFTPEAGYGYDHLSASNDNGGTYGVAYSWDMNRVFGGARLAFGHFVVPSVYGHVGYGWRTTSEPTVVAANGTAVDVGGALDFRIIRQFQFGLYGEWVTIDAQPYAPEWVAIGAHVDLAL
jgi:hypothetical protein